MVAGKYERLFPHMVLQERTIIRLTEEPSEEDALHLQQMCVLYGKMLVKFLAALQTKELRAEVLRPRDFRNRLVDALELKDPAFEKHIAGLKDQGRRAEIALLKHLREMNRSAVPHLQARHWKLALEEAVNTMSVHWGAVCYAVRKSLDACRLPEDKVNGEDRHYYNWVLKSDSRQFFHLLNGGIPDPTYDGLLAMGFTEKEATGATFETAPVRLRNLALHALSRIHKIRHRRVRAPHLRPPTNRMRFDCCSIAVKKVEKEVTVNGKLKKIKTQIVSLMSLIPRRRIKIVLKGFSAFRGNVQLFWKDGGFVFHVYKDLKCEEPRTEGKELGIDLGYTEVLTDSEGKRYGDGYGEASSAVSDKRCRVQRTRNRLGAAARNKQKSGIAKEIKKAKNIVKHNLGKKKQKRRYRRDRALLTSYVNQALNELFRSGVKVVVMERISAVLRACYGKIMNRRLSNWLRGYIRERIHFKAKKFGVQTVEVNPAYSSVACPRCGFCDRKNRAGDKFKCRFCGLDGKADHLAAVNILWRRADPEITIDTPKEVVLQIMKDRSKKFRRLENCLLAA
jgi:IS605 OrfB family transposase